MSVPTVATYKSMYVIPGTADKEDDDVIQLALDAAATTLDQAYGRSFDRATGVAKEFKAAYYDHIDVVDLISATTIEVDTNYDGTYATELSTSDYRLEPVNQPRYQRITRRPNSAQSWGVGQWVRVTGDWGYVESDGSPPANVLQARLLVAHRLIRRKDAPFGVLSFPEMGEAVRMSRTDPDVDMLMQDYDRTESPMAYIA